MSAAQTDPKPLVLVVDDDEAIRRLVRLALLQRFEVIEAEDAFQAIELVATRDVEVVLIDVMMPGMTGIEAVPKLKEKARGPLPVLLLTALDAQDQRNRGLEAGADDYLSKPVDRRELVLRVQNFVRLRRQEQLIRSQLSALTELYALKDDLTALDLLKVRMLEQGKLALERVPTVVSELAATSPTASITRSSAFLPSRKISRSVIETLRTAAMEGRVKVQQLDSGDTAMELDAKLVKRALENLLINAFRHTNDWVEVSITGDAQAVTLVVADRGPGVPDFLKGELFDMFGSITLQKAGARRGHGLGLYLVKLVAQAHGGSVVVKDRSGGGAEFVITLPRPAA
ncbi:MAG: response regulator [Archangium sp.]|nr:response regulator [Archangium sp.]